MTEEVEQKWISGFWRRIGALFLDALILGVVGFILGLVFESTFVQIGAWGRLVGFAIALVYFGIGNSAITGGQTIGKKALKLRVVDSEKSPVGVSRSLLRYIILATPFSLNGSQFSTEVMQSFLMYPLSLIVFGGVFSILYLYIFNRLTRQSLHDLAVGTFVVNSGVDKQEVGKVWRAHIMVVAMLCVASVIVPAFTAQLAQSEPFKEMLSVHSALLNEPYVSHATISTNTRILITANRDAKTSSSVNSQIFLKSNTINDVKMARRLAAIVIASYPEAANKNAIQITLTYGYDIGIASKWSSHPHSFSPDEIQGAE